MTDIVIVEVDRAFLCATRTPDGAARAIADDIRTRVAKSGTDALSDDEHAAIVGEIGRFGRIDLNQGPQLDHDLLGLERATQIAFRVNAAYSTRSDVLRD